MFVQIQWKNQFLQYAGMLTVTEIIIRNIASHFGSCCVYNTTQNQSDTYYIHAYNK